MGHEEATLNDRRYRCRWSFPPPRDRMLSRPLLVGIKNQVPEGPRKHGTRRRRSLPVQKKSKEGKHSRVLEGVGGRA